jgi:hypothetical protein
MTGKTSALVLALLALAAMIGVVAAQNEGQTKTRTGEVDSALVGEWHGDSICVVRESACRDEDSLYQISKIPEKTGQFSLMAAKIVDGKPITMGTSECTYHPKQRTLECPISKGSILRFSVEGNAMHGTMTLADKRIWRQITLKKIVS